MFPHGLGPPKKERALLLDISRKRLPAGRVQGKGLKKDMRGRWFETFFYGPVFGIISKLIRVKRTEHIILWYEFETSLEFHLAFGRFAGRVHYLFEATQHTKQFLDVCSAIKILRLRHIQCSLKYGSVDNKTQLQVGGIVIFAVYLYKHVLNGSRMCGTCAQLTDIPDNGVA